MKVVRPNQFDPEVGGVVGSEVVGKVLDHLLDFRGPFRAVAHHLDDLEQVLGTGRAAEIVGGDPLRPVKIGGAAHQIVGPLSLPLGGAGAAFGIVCRCHGVDYGGCFSYCKQFACTIFRILEEVCIAHARRAEPPVDDLNVLRIYLDADVAASEFLCGNQRGPASGERVEHHVTPVAP